ncbi:MAG: hypothetical protein ACP5O0_04455 [Acidimicrobiales bacterium]
MTTSSATEVEYLYAVKRNDAGAVESVARSPRDSLDVEIFENGKWHLSASNVRTSPRLGSKGSYLTITDKGYVACTEAKAMEFLGIPASAAEADADKRQMVA